MVYDRTMGGYRADVRTAAEVVARTQFGSQAMLQRRLRIGHQAAEQLLDDLERAGIVGPRNGAEPREVLVRPDRAHILICAQLGISPTHGGAGR